MSTRREDFFSDGRKEKQNASRASNKTRENDQSFAVWPMGGSGGVRDATRSERGEKTREGGVKLGERRTRSGVGGLGSN